MDIALVSAVITTHNRCELLSRAIESVLSQTYASIECIVVDDASTDGTESVCANYSVSYIKIPKKESRGGNYARNLGIKASKGKYVAFLDDDDYWLPEKIRKQVELIEQTGCELVYCGNRLEKVGTDDITYAEVLPDHEYQGDMSRKILQVICTTTTNILVSREALMEVGCFDENLKFWQEYELTIRLAQRQPFCFVDEALSVYRIDQRDANRLTNKFFEWKKAVRYIHRKHHVLYRRLSFWERQKARELVWRDARNRCLNSGLKVRQFYYNQLLRFSHIFRKLYEFFK